MKSDLIAAYAKLTILNAFESEEYKNTLNININNKPVKFERIYSSIKDNEIDL